MQASAGRTPLSERLAFPRRHLRLVGAAVAAMLVGAAGLASPIVAVALLSSALAILVAAWRWEPTRPGSETITALAELENITISWLGVAGRNPVTISPSRVVAVVGSVDDNFELPEGSIESSADLGGFLRHVHTVNSTHTDEGFDVRGVLVVNGTQRLGPSVAATHRGSPIVLCSPDRLERAVTANPLR